MSESELKFTVDPAHVHDIELALRRLPSTRATIESRYFDTDQGLLAGAGLSLRLRRTGRVWEQTLKSPGRHVAERGEETVARPGRWGSDGPPLDLGLHRGTASGELLRSILKHAGVVGSPLDLQSTSRIVRRSAMLDGFGANVEVAFDKGEIRAAEHAIPVCELEYELKAGDARALVAFGRAAIDDHGVWLSTLSKAARGARLAAGDAVSPAATRARAPRLKASMSATHVLRSVLRSCFDQVAANASEIAAGRPDAEAIHQLRVGLRRLRTVSRELQGFAAGLDRSFEVVMARVFRQLGELRDRSVVAGSMQSALLAAGSPEPLLHPPASDPVDPVATLRANDFQQALMDVLELVLAPSPLADDARGRPGGATPASGETDAPLVLRHLGVRLDALRRRLARDAKRFEALSPEAQHKTRKRLKRLRYLAELVASLYDTPAVRRYLARLEPAQEALGARIDLFVALGMARDATQAGETKAWFNVGWLTAQLPSSAERCRKSLKRAASGKPFW